MSKSWSCITARRVTATNFYVISHIVTALAEMHDFWKLKSKIFMVSILNIVRCMCDSRRGFGLDIGFIDHFNTQLVITLNYSSIAHLHTSQITRAHRLVFSVCYSLY
jgi:hypothetical protein